MRLKAPFPEEDKVMTLEEAIKKFVNDGDVVYVGGFQLCIPIEACFEIVRQKKRNLTCWTVGHDTVLAIDLLVGTGCCKEVHYGWFASWPVRRPPATIRAYKEGKVKLYQYSNYTAMIALLGAYFGWTFAPSLSDHGSDLVKYNPNLIYTECPFTKKKYVAVKCPEIDVAIIHCQRADRYGNGQKWMSRTVSDEWGAGAAKRVIITCEELVPNEVIRHDPDRTMIPFWKTCAVVEVPWGAHPTGMYGYYIRDQPFETYAARHFMREDLMWKFIEEWVLGCSNREEYIKHYVEKFGWEALERLRIKHHIYPIAPVDYGYTGWEVFKGVEYPVEEEGGGK